MPPLFLPAEYFYADTLLSTWTKAANCTSGWAMCVCCRERWDTQVFFRGSVKLIYGTTDEAMNCFEVFLTHFWVPSFFRLLQLEHFSNATWDINTIFLWGWFPTRILWPLWTSVSPSISNVHLLLTNSSPAPVMFGSTKTVSFCKKARNCVKKRYRGSK